MIGALFLSKAKFYVKHNFLNEVRAMSHSNADLILRYHFQNISAFIKPAR